MRQINVKSWNSTSCVDGKDIQNCHFTINIITIFLVFLIKIKIRHVGLKLSSVNCYFLYSFIMCFYIWNTSYCKNGENVHFHRNRMNTLFVVWTFKNSDFSSIFFYFLLTIFSLIINTNSCGEVTLKYVNVGMYVCL